MGTVILLVLGVVLVILVVCGVLSGKAERADHGLRRRLASGGYVVLYERVRIVRLLGPGLFLLLETILFFGIGGGRPAAFLLLLPFGGLAVGTMAACLYYYKWRLTVEGDVVTVRAPLKKPVVLRFGDITAVKVRWMVSRERLRRYDLFTGEYPMWIKRVATVNEEMTGYERFVVALMGCGAVWDDSTR